MPLDSATVLTASDWDAVRVFAESAGLEPAALVRLAVRALADHVRVNGSLVLPVRLGPPLPACASCPAFQNANPTKMPAAPGEIIAGPWSQNARES